MPTYSELNKFHATLDKNRLFLIKDSLSNAPDEFVCLKRDVECKVKKAYKLCKAENKFGIKATYYVQHSLLKKEKNLKYLNKMKSLGADICYHHDVMDANGGDLQKAEKDFGEKFNDFKKLGFCISSVCQHGNPVIERVGYSSNRDFFRSELIKQKYPDVVDVVVDSSKYFGQYTYISDVGYRWKEILSPEQDGSKTKPLKGIGEVIAITKQKKRVIISVHTHRLNANKFTEKVSLLKFFFIRHVARLLMRIPFLKKIMARFYYLARKV